MHVPSHDCHVLYLVPEDMSTMGFSMESTMFVLEQDHKIGFGIGFYRSRSSRPSLRILDRQTSDSFARRSLEVLASRPHHFRNMTDLSIILSASTEVPWLFRATRTVEHGHGSRPLNILCLDGCRRGQAPHLSCPQAFKHLRERQWLCGRLWQDDMVAFSVARRLLFFRWGSRTRIIEETRGG